jgi:hypothetical protein
MEEMNRKTLRMNVWIAGKNNFKGGNCDEVNGK